VAGPDRNPSYPQIAGGRVTWVQSTPLDSDPEEFSRMPIYGVRVNADGSPAGDPDELVSSAIANVVGDSGWTYSLTPSYLVWEQAQADSGFDAGSHVLTLGDAQTSSLGGDAWRPSASGDVVVYASGGLKAKDLSSQRVWNVDAAGDFPRPRPRSSAISAPSRRATPQYTRSWPGGSTTGRSKCWPSEQSALALGSGGRFGEPCGVR